MTGICVCVCAAVSSNRLAEVEYVILKEWFDFLVASQDIKVDLFGMSSLYIIISLAGLMLLIVVSRRLAAANRLRISICLTKFLALAGVVDHVRKFPLTLFDHHTKLGWCLSNCGCVYAGGPKKFGECWGHALWMGDMSDPLEINLSPRVLLC